MPTSPQLVLTVVFLALVGSSRVATVSGEWPTWRGGQLEGSSEAESAPIVWSPKDNVRWKTMIPGRGHSSPVISDGRVYVTTAYLTQRSTVAKKSVKLLKLLIVLMLAILAVQKLVELSKPLALGKPYALRLATTASFFLLVMFLVVVSLFGESALDFDRCEIRAWLGSGIIVTIAIFLAAFGLPSKARLRSLLALFLMAFGPFVVLASPAQEHTLRSGYLSTGGIVILSVGVLPVVLGISLQLGFLAARSVRNADGAQEGTTLTRHGTVALHVLLFGLLYVWGCALAARFISSSISPISTLPGPIGAGQRLAASLAALLGAGITTGAFFSIAVGGGREPDALREFETSKSSLRILLLAGAVVLAVTVVSVLIPRLVFISSPYLHYQLSAGRVEPAAGWAGVVLVALAIVGSLAFEILRRRPVSPARRNPAHFAAAAIALAVVTFADTNYLAARSVLARAILALDAASGAILWRSEGLDAPTGRLHRMNSPASPTPAKSRNRVCAFFGSAGVYCSDLKGKVVWRDTTVRFHSAYGAGASPIAHGDVLVVTLGSAIEPYIVAFDILNGRQKWRVAMRGEPQISGNSRTPIVKTIGGRETLVVWDFEDLAGYDLDSGELLWSVPVDPGEGDLVASLVSDEEHIYAIGYGRAAAVKTSELRGPSSPILWKTSKTRANVASPVLANGIVFTVSDRGIASSWDQATGERFWRQRLAQGKYFASPVVVGDKVYFTSEDGVTTVLRASETFEKLAESRIGDRVFASLAPVDGSLYIRTASSVVRIDP